MLGNYQYFIALAEERNISKAANKLFISHQCLSRYLKNLEEEYHVTFFERSPKLTLTAAGEIYLATAQQMQILEENMSAQLSDVRQSKRGIIRLGTTDGRYRILIPDLLAKFKELYPDITLDVHYSTTSKLLSQEVLENNLDFVLLNQRDLNYAHLKVQPVLEEEMFLVISDQMLQRYFPSRYPACIQEFSAGVDLAEFKNVPFVLSKRGYNSREALDRHLMMQDLTLDCVMELEELDLHYMMTARNYAASFCWSMYISIIQQINRDQKLNHLYIFPLKGKKIKNRLVLATRKGKIFPSYTKDLISQIMQQCATFADPDLNSI